MNSHSVKYHPLSQTAPSDDEDEGFHDNILYDSRLVGGPSTDHRNVFELERLGQPRARSPVSVQYLGQGRRRTCLLAAVLLLILLTVAVAVLFPILSHTYNHGIVTDVHAGKTSPDWTTLFNTTWAESNVNLVDADGDGLVDVLIGLSTQGETELHNQADGLTREYCSSQDGQFPFSGQVMALRGYDGKELWHSPTRSRVLYLNCMDIDVNGDGRMDCIVTGRESTGQAIDVQTGNTLWAVEPCAVLWSSHFVPEWNIRGAVTLPDLDDDGVLDLLVTHELDKDKLEYEQHGRTGRLILLSGKTGQPIGHRYIEFAEGQDALMLPVKYVTHDKAVYVIFGSGGMNNTGHLLAVSLPDLYLWATNRILTSVDLSLYTWLAAAEKDERGLASVLFRAKHPGVMMNPVLVDVDKDDHIDLLVSSSDGCVALLDGKTLQQEWMRIFDGMQIYSSPTPGHFDADSVTDFMIHLTKDICGGVNISQTLVVSGVNGETLWSVYGQFWSHLSLDTHMDSLSVFVISALGTDTAQALQHFVREGKTGSESVPGLNIEEFQSFCVGLRQQVASSHVTCDDDLESLTENVYLLDRVVQDRPLRLVVRKSNRYHYNLHHSPGQLHCHNVSDTSRDKIDMCTVLVPYSYSGDADDVDADGSLDYIHVTQMIGLNRSDTLDVTSFIGSVVISKHNIDAAVAREDFLHTSPVSEVVHRQPWSNHQHVQSSWHFLHSDLQTLTQFFSSWRGRCLLVPQ